MLQTKRSRPGAVVASLSSEDFFCFVFASLLCKSGPGPGLAVNKNNPDNSQGGRRVRITESQDQSQVQTSCSNKLMDHGMLTGELHCTRLYCTPFMSRLLPTKARFRGETEIEREREREKKAAALLIGVATTINNNNRCFFSPRDPTVLFLPNPDENRGRQTGTYYSPSLQTIQRRVDTGPSRAQAAANGSRNSHSTVCQFGARRRASSSWWSKSNEASYVLRGNPSVSSSPPRLSSRLVSTV